MFAQLQAHRDADPGRPAVTTRGRDESQSTLTWDALVAAVRHVATRARDFAAGPVVVVSDASTSGIATLIGVLAAGRDALLLDAVSDLLDGDSAARRVGAATVLGPRADVAAAAAAGIDLLPYDISAPPGDPADDDLTRCPTGLVLHLTSGSTGVPRVVRHSLPASLVSATSYVEVFGLSRSDTVLVPVPATHSYGLAAVCATLLAGATLVTFPGFAPGRVVSAMQEDATVLFGTPFLHRMLVPLLRSRGRPPRLRLAVSASGPLAPDDAATVADALGVPVRQIYGITEVGLVACVPSTVADWEAGSVGPAAPGVEVRIVPEPGTDPHVPGAGGRLLVRTRSMFEGYWDDPRPATGPDGFYDTGDLVRLTGDGHLQVIGRRTGVVDVGGRKVSPSAVEAALLAHPAVADAHVLGLDRGDGSQQVHALVVLRTPTEPAEILAFCRARSLRRHEVPHRLHIVRHVPRTSLGKVDRRRAVELTGDGEPPVGPAGS